MNIFIKASFLSLAVITTGCASNNSSQLVSNNYATKPNDSRKASAWEKEQRPLSTNQQAFIQDVYQRYQIPTAVSSQIIENAQYNATTARLMRPTTSSGKPIKRVWSIYRSRFVEPIRIRAGTQFWNNNRSILAKAERTYGVPAAIISGIIGVETIYGRNMGNFRLLDALYTLGFNHPDVNNPQKSLPFRNQLAALIKLHNDGKLNAYTAKGSFAGAMGLPQFMPMSIMEYAVDGDGDGQIDLTNSKADAIMSVARYLKEHGWQSNMPTFAPVNLNSSCYRFVDGKLDPAISWDQLKTCGAQARSGGNWQQGKVLSVIDLKDESTGQNEYRTATQNFFAITKYNRSYFYAASVADLAEELAKAQLNQGNQVTLPY